MINTIVLGLLYVLGAALAAPAPDSTATLDASSGESAAGFTCPGAGDCCIANGSPGCEDQTCCETVCAIDPPCCSVSGWWDSICASEAADNCPGVCSSIPNCPGSGDCCTNNGTPGCEIAACCDLVCSNTPSCCEAVWSQTCADLAVILCADSAGCMPITCPGTGDCCAANGTPGCYDECCCSAVCADAQYASCCTTEWTADCAAAAATLCPGSCAPPEPGCPGPGSCFEAHLQDEVGCDDELCCSLVCAADNYCCNTQWDSTCAGEAADLCTCTPPVCPGQGDCCTATGTPGCDAADCCELVCQSMPSCCAPDGVWDGECALIAQELCSAICTVCPDGTISRMAPPAGWQDAGQPHPLTNADSQQGTSVLIVAGPPGAVSLACWDLCETTQNVALHPTIAPNTIDSVSEDTPGVYAVTLAHPLMPGELTRLTYAATSSSHIDYVALPADVNMNGTTDPSDILAVIDCINHAASFECTYANADVDRDGNIEPPDIIRVIDLLNGASAFEPWFGAQVIDTAECP